MSEPTFKLQRGMFESTYRLLRSDGKGVRVGSDWLNTAVDLAHGGEKWRGDAFVILGGSELEDDEPGVMFWSLRRLMEAARGVVDTLPAAAEPGTPQHALVTELEELDTALKRHAPRAPK